MSLDLTMKALADEVRALSGTTEDKSIELMTSDVNAANTLIYLGYGYDNVPDVILPDGLTGGCVYLPTQDNFEIYS